VLAEALAHYDECGEARAIRQLGHRVYLGPGHEDDPPAISELVSDALRACLTEP
jgi:hypothetical protein